jgi:hypothetical protein
VLVAAAPPSAKACTTAAAMALVALPAAAALATALVLTTALACRTRMAWPVAQDGALRVARAAARIVNLVNLAPLVTAPAEELRADFHAAEIDVHTVCGAGSASACGP